MATSRKAIGIIIVAAIVAIGALTLTSGVASAAVINVPGDYTTIQQAIHNVTPANRTIEVNATAYNAQGIPETVVVNQSNIIIRSVNGRAVVSAGGASDHVFNITDQTNVTLEGFTIRDARNIAGGGYLAGIWMYNASECIISNNMVTNISATLDTDVYGIRLNDSHNNRFSSSTSVFTITSEAYPAYGIWLGSSNNNTFSSNTSVSNITGDYAYGISLESSNNTMFSASTTVSNINGDYYAYGIWLDQPGYNRFSASTSVSNITSEQSSAFGILLISASNNNTFSASTSVSNITSEQSSAFGIYLVSSNNTMFSASTSVSNITGLGACGIVLEVSNNNTFSSSTSVSNITATDSQAYGIVLEVSNNNTFSSSTSVSNITANRTAFGIYLSYSRNNTFTDFTITEITSGGGTTSYGVSMGDSSENTLSGGNIFSTGEPRIDYAVWLENCTHNTINESDIRDNGHGFRLNQSDNNTIERNTIVNNTALAVSGVSLTNGSDNNEIHENCFYDNGLVHQALDDGTPGTNNWNGNFWSDYLPPPPYRINGTANSTDSDPLPCCPSLEKPPAKVPTLTPAGIIVLVGVLSAIAAIALRKRR